MKELLDYWLILYNKRWLILAITIIAMLTAGIMSVLLSPVYESKAVFFVPQNPDIVSFLSTSEGSLIRSPLLPQVAEEPHSPFLGILKSKSIKELVQKDFPHKTLKDLRRDVDFSLSNNYMIRIYARDNDSIKAAGIANSYITYLNQLLGSYSQSLLEKNETMIEKEIILVKDRLNAARKALRDFQEQNSVISLKEEQQRLISQRAGFQLNLEQSQVLLRENTIKIAALDVEKEKEAALFASSEFAIESPLLFFLRRDLSNIEVKLAGMRVDKKETHPDYIALKQQHDQLKQNMGNEIERIVNSKIKRGDTLFENLRTQIITLHVEKQRIQASIEAYNAVIESLDGKIQLLPELFVKEDKLRMDVAKLRTMVSTLEMKYEESRMQKERVPQVVVTVEEAVPADTPSFPLVWLNVSVALILGLSGGIFYCFFIHYLEETREERIFNIVKAIGAPDRED